VGAKFISPLAFKFLVSVLYVVYFVVVLDILCRVDSGVVYMCVGKNYKIRLEAMCFIFRTSRDSICYMYILRF
jgi:hypothetical protein